MRVFGRSSPVGVMPSRERASRSRSASTADQDRREPPVTHLTGSRVRTKTAGHSKSWTLQVLDTPSPGHPSFEDSPMKRVVLPLCPFLSALFPIQAVAAPEGGEELGPNGEVPRSEVTDEVIRAFAKGTGMTVDESRFAAGDGSRVVLDFITQHADDPDFGEVRVLNDGRFQAQIRTTSKNSILPELLEKLLGRKVDRFVGGLSAAALLDEIGRVQGFVESLPGLDEASFITTNFETGQVVVVVGEEVRGLADRLQANGFDEVEIRIDDALLVATSYAGASLSNGVETYCSLGYVARQASTGRMGMVTAGHCADGAGWATNGSHVGYFTLVEPGTESCTPHDRQLHRLYATNSATENSGFYDYFGQWSSIRNVAGGYYVGQTVFRRGQHTVELALVKAREYSRPNLNGGDCGASFSVTGHLLDRVFGSSSIAGDSGGPWYLLYNNMWYLAGTNHGRIDPYDGYVYDPNDWLSPSESYVAWISVPAGWAPCTELAPCP